jgi:hypothetical protein
MIINWQRSTLANGIILMVNDGFGEEKGNIMSLFFKISNYISQKPLFVFKLFNDSCHKQEEIF